MEKQPEDNNRIGLVQQNDEIYQNQMLEKNPDQQIEQIEQNNQVSLENNNQDSKTNTNHNNENEEDQSQYFQMMGIVGHGKYQNISMVVWSVLWLTTGTILLGTPFFMLNPPYTCTNTVELALLTSEQCQEYVCALPEQQRHNFIDSNSFKTISNNFNDIHCEKGWMKDMISSLVYLGCFFGYLSISILVDNLGRKLALLVAYGVATIGMIVAVISGYLVGVGIGLFLMGFGSDSAINICFYFITETMEAKYRMKYSILIQIFFCLGGVVNIGYFYLFRDWRIVTCVFLIIPSAISIFVITKVVKDTPYFLIKRLPEQQIMQQLNQIHLFNTGQKLSIQQQSKLKPLIQKLKKTQQPPIQSQENQQSKTTKTRAHIYTPLDLFRFPSIRFISVAVCLLSTFIYILYYGPLMLIDKLSFSLYVNALVVTGSQLITYPFSYFLIHRIKRKYIGVILNIVCAANAFGLIFLMGNHCPDGEVGLECQVRKGFQLVHIFMFRFCSSLQFAIFLVYCNQVFPTQIRGLGIGFSSALGTVASTASPYIFGSNLKSSAATANIMIVFVALSMVSVGLWLKLPETLNAKIIDEISEVSSMERPTKMQGHLELLDVKQTD